MSHEYAKSLMKVFFEEEIGKEKRNVQGLRNSFMSRSKTCLMLPKEENMKEL